MKLLEAFPLPTCPAQPFGNLEVAVSISFADRWAAGSADVELHAAMGGTAEERRILALVYK